MKKRLIASLLLTTTMLTMFAACGSKEETKAETSTETKTEATTEGKEVIINYPTMQVGVNTSAPVVAQLIEEFNEENAGKYKVVVEEVPGDANYVDKIKVMLGNGELPPVIYGAGYNLLDLALEQGLAVSLDDAMAADPDWYSMLGQSQIDVNSREGSLYAVSNETSVIGYYYNKDLFAKAGIDAPAETWEELFEQCDTLLAAGITPFALDTADSAWVSSLWLGAMVATESEAGYDFMQVMNPDDYNTPEFVAGLEKLQLMFEKYTTLDAIGGKYENAANNFLSGEAAMIANGSWMMGDFSDETKAPAGFADVVGVAAYPGNLIYNDPIQGFIVTKQADPAVEEAAIAFVKHMTSAHAQLLGLEMQGIVPASSSVEVSDAARESFPLLAEIIELNNNADFISKYMQATVYPNLNDVMSQELPNLATASITCEEFAQIFTDSAAKNK